MKITKELFLSILTILPISAISFAAEYGIKVSDRPIDPKEVETEFLERLDNHELPLKYYNFLQEHKVPNTETLLSDDFEEQKTRLLEEYIKDFKNPFARSSGTISVF